MGRLKLQAGLYSLWTAEISSSITDCKREMMLKLLRNPALLQAAQLQMGPLPPAFYIPVNHPEGQGDEPRCRLPVSSTHLHQDVVTAMSTH